MVLPKGEVRKLQLYGGLFRCLSRIYTKNVVNTPNLYTKKALQRIISAEFGVADSRAINSKLTFAITKNFIFINTKGYSINPDITKFYKKFKEKQKDYLDEFEIEYL